MDELFRRSITLFFVEKNQVVFLFNVSFIKSTIGRNVYNSVNKWCSNSIEMSCALCRILWSDIFHSSSKEVKKNKRSLPGPNMLPHVTIMFVFNNYLK